VGDRRAQEVRALVVVVPLLQERLAEVLAADHAVVARPAALHVRRPRAALQQPQQHPPERPVRGALLLGARDEHPEPHPVRVRRALLEQGGGDRRLGRDPTPGEAGVEDEEQLVRSRAHAPVDHVRDVDPAVFVAGLQPQRRSGELAMPTPHMTRGAASADPFTAFR